MKPCTATKKNGEPCGMPAGPSGLCFAHDPAASQARQAARKRGGRNRHTPHAGNPESIPSDITTIQDARAVIAYALAELIVMDNSIPRVRALLACAEMYFKSIELGEHEERLQALEKSK